MADETVDLREKVVAARSGEKRMLLIQDLAGVLNKHCAENGSNTPDFVLAEVALRAVEDFSAGVNRRQEWYGAALPNLEAEALSITRFP